VQAAPVAPSTIPAATAVAPALPVDAADLQRWTSSVGASATLTEDRTLASTPYGTLSAAEGTRLSTQVTRNGLVINAEPPFTFNPRVGPRITISNVNYNFSTAEFDVQAEGPGPDALYSAAASAAANRVLRPLLPDAFQRPGYSPQTDPQLQQRVQDALRGVSSGGASSGVPLRDVTAYAHVTAGREIRTDLTNDVRMTIPEGAQFTITTSTSGPADHPVLNSATISTGGRGIMIQRTSGFAAQLQGAEINRVTLSRGGNLDVQYELVPEQLAQGVAAGVQLFGLLGSIASGNGAAAERFANARIPEARLPGMRRIVDEAVERDVEPGLRQLFRQYDDAVPGLSLTELMDLPEE